MRRVSAFVITVFESTVQTLRTSNTFDELDDLASGACTPAIEMDMTEVDLLTTIGSFDSSSTSYSEDSLSPSLTSPSWSSLPQL